jgi:hypothetical protein
MKHLFVPYELALQLKEKGFDEPCFGWWCWINGTAAHYYPYITNNQNLIDLNNHPKNCSAPIYQQVISWLLKKLNPVYPEISIEIFFDGSGNWVTDTTHYGFRNLREGIEQGLKLI